MRVRGKVPLIQRPKGVGYAPFVGCAGSKAAPGALYAERFAFVRSRAKVVFFRRRFLASPRLSESFFLVYLYQRCMNSIEKLSN